MKKVISIFLLIATASSLSAQPFYEKWVLTSAGIRRGAASFVDKWVGIDGLPYTADDENLPPGGNAGGTWTASWLDNDGNPSTQEYRFALSRQGDDDLYTLASNSEFEYGVIGEGQDWKNFHNADNLGPCADPATSGCLPGDDFEHNDSVSNREEKSNWYWYNNIQANQRGLGGSKYYFEWKDAVLNRGYFDEAQGWRKGVALERRFNNGQLPERKFAKSHAGTIKGLLIPVADIAGLKNGELDPLFGWHAGDMAAYVRDRLLPKLLDENLEIFLISLSCASAGLPPAQLVIEQGEFVVGIVNSDDALASASYFGIVPSGIPDTMNAEGWIETRSVYRWSAVHVLWEDPRAAKLSRSPAIQLTPVNGVIKNLWSRDAFNRRTVSLAGIADELGHLELGCEQRSNPADPGEICWQFRADAQDAGEAPCHRDGTLYLPGGAPVATSWAQIPLTGVNELSADYGKIHGEADLQIPDESTSVYLILTQKNQPVAWAALKPNAVPRLGIGGSFASAIPIEDGLATSDGSSPLAIAIQPGHYTRFEMVLDFEPGSVELFQAGVKVAALDFTSQTFSRAGVDGLRVWAGGSVTLDQMGLLSGLYTRKLQHFIRGDFDNSQALDIGDAVQLLTFKFIGGAPPECEDSSDANDDGQIDITDAVVILTYLFVDGLQKLAFPFGDPPFTASQCGADPSPEDGLGCNVSALCP